MKYNFEFAKKYFNLGLVCEIEIVNMFKSP